MNSRKITKHFLVLTVALALIWSCSDDCTKMVNIPQYDPIEMTFNDNFQEVPCDFEEPVNEPVN